MSAKPMGIANIARLVLAAVALESGVTHLQERVVHTASAILQLAREVTA